MENIKIFVIGTGSWGTALAVSLCNAQKNVCLWGRRPELVNDLIATHRSAYLPNIIIPNTLNVTSNFSQILEADVILWVAPVQQSAHMISTLKDYFPPKASVIICSKGLDLKTKQPLSTIFKNTISNQIGILSGPNFADEVAKGLPAASTLAFSDLEHAINMSAILRHRTFRVYAHHDPIGVELCAALKNVMAIAAGIVTGKELGQNCLATVITRASAEIRRIVIACGGDHETTQTLAGIGDLMLTCSSVKSRNTSLGIALAQGQDLTTILNARQNVTEGVPTAKVAYELASKHNVHAPIINAVYKILHQNYEIGAVLNELLNHQQQQQELN